MKKMKTIKLLTTQNNFNQIIHKVIEDDEMIKIKSNTGNAILISESVWLSIQETLYLVSLPV